MSTKIICVNLMMVNYFCGIVDRRKAFSLFSSRDHCQRFSPSLISDTPLAGFGPAPSLSSGFDEWSFAVVITTTITWIDNICRHVRIKATNYFKHFNSQYLEIAYNWYFDSLSLLLYKSIFHEARVFSHLRYVNVTFIPKTSSETRILKLH